MRRAALVVSGLLIAFAMPLTADSLRAECTNYGECGYCVPGISVSSNDVAMVGTYACVAGASSFAVVDVSDPASPHLVGSISNRYGPASMIATSGTMAYVIERNYGTYLRVISVSNPSAPQERACRILPADPTPFSITADGSLVCVTYFAFNPMTWGLLVIDVTDPSNPRTVGNMNTLHRADDAAIHGTTVCVADEDAGLRVIDVSVPASPRIVATVPMNATRVVMDGNLAYVSTYDPSNLFVVYLANPATPQVIATRALPFYVSNLSTSGSQLFGAAGTNGVLDVDVSWPGWPCVVGQYPTLGSAKAVAAMGTVACVATDCGLRVIDPVNPPRQLSLLPLAGPAGAIATRGSTAYIVSKNSSGDSFHVIDVTDPEVPVLQGGGPYVPNTATAITLSGDYAYVGETGEGWSWLCVVDISDPAAPNWVGDAWILSDHLTSWIYGLAQRGDYLYAAATSTGLVTFDVSDPTAPVAMPHIDTPSSAYGIGIEGQYAFLLCQTGLLVYDLADPASPQLLTTFDTPGSASCMLVDSGRAYVAGSAGFDVIDLSAPLSPQLIGSLPGIPTCSNITRSGDFAYLNCPSQGILCVSIANPAAPELVGYLSALQGPHAVAATGNAVCVADDIGLRVLPVQCMAAAVGDEIPPPRALSVWPNPAHGQAEIRFTLDAASPARLDLFDATGRLVRRVLDRPLAPGPQMIPWTTIDDRGRALPAGVYRMRLDAGGATRVGTAIVVR